MTGVTIAAAAAAATAAVREVGPAGWAGVREVPLVAVEWMARAFAATPAAAEEALLPGVGMRERKAGLAAAPACGRERTRKGNVVRDPQVIGTLQSYG